MPSYSVVPRRSVNLSFSVPSELIVLLISAFTDIGHYSACSCIARLTHYSFPLLTQFECFALPALRALLGVLLFG